LDRRPSGLYVGRQAFRFNLAMGDQTSSVADSGLVQERLAAAAKRALAEAAERRSAAGAAPSRPAEMGGPKGPEPTRYGDWDVKGRASDF
jgi:hypothetical protein